jgi:hypothetical protein
MEEKKEKKRKEKREKMAWNYCDDFFFFSSLFSGFSVIFFFLLILERMRIELDNSFRFPLMTVMNSEGAWCYLGYLIN